MKTIFNLFHYLTICFFSFNAYAYGPGVTLLSSKVEMSPGIQGGFIEKNSPSLLGQNGSAQAFAQASSVFGKKAENIRINGSHAYIIQNKTGHGQNYVIEYKLTLNDGRFIRKSDIVLINDNTVSRGAAVSYTNQYFPSTGAFHFTVETSIKGAHSDYKSDGNYVHVS